MEARIVRHVPASHRLGLLESGLPGAHRGGGVEGEDMPERNEVTQPRRILDDPLREALVDEPHRRECMPLHEHDERVEPHGLQRGGEQERQVEAAPHPVAQELVGQADLLAMRLEARGRLRIAEPQVLHGLVQREDHRTHVDRAASLVAGEASVPHSLLEHAADVLEHLGHHGMGGCGEADEQAQGCARPGPVVVREHLYVRTAQGDSVLLLPQRPAELRPLGLDHRPEMSDGKAQVDEPQADLLTWRKRRNRDANRIAQLGDELKLEDGGAERGGPGVPDPHVPDERDAALLHRKVQRGRRQDFDEDVRGGSGGSGHFARGRRGLMPAGPSSMPRTRRPRGGSPLTTRALPSGP